MEIENKFKDNKAEFLALCIQENLEDLHLDITSTLPEVCNAIVLCENEKLLTWIANNFGSEVVLYIRNLALKGGKSEFAYDCCNFELRNLHSLITKKKIRITPLTFKFGLHFGLTSFLETLLNSEEYCLVESTISHSITGENKKRRDGDVGSTMHTNKKILIRTLVDNDSQYWIKYTLDQNIEMLMFLLKQIFEDSYGFLKSGAWGLVLEKQLSKVFEKLLVTQLFFRNMCDQSLFLKDMCKELEQKGALDLIKIYESLLGKGALWPICYGKDKEVISPFNDFYVATKFGHLHVLEWGVSQGKSMEKVYQGAIDGGHRNIIDWAESKGLTAPNEAMESIAKKGSFELLFWAKRHGLIPTSKTYKEAVAHDGFYMVLLSEFPKDNFSIEKVLCGAVKYNKKDLLMAFSKTYPANFNNPKLIISALGRGHFELFDWLRDNFSSWKREHIKTAFEIAVKKNNLNVVKYICKNLDFRPTSEKIFKLFKEDKLEIFKYLIKNKIYDGPVHWLYLSVSSNPVMQAFVKAHYNL